MRFLTIFILLTTLQYNANAFDHYSLNTSEGLPSSNIWCLYQDSIGYMWMGTANGLVRYDGSEFEMYDEEDGLIGNSVVSISPDLNGGLLIGSYEEGIVNLKTIPHLNVTNKRRWRANIHTVETENFIYSKRFVDIAIFDKSKNKDASRNSLQLTKKFEIGYIAQTNDKVLATSNEGLKFIEEGQVLAYYPENKSCQESMHSIFETKTGEIICGGIDKIFKILPNACIELDTDLNYNISINSIVVDSDGKLWLAISGKGLVVLEKTADNSYVSIYTNFDIHINDIELDQQGNVWLATFGQGILVFPNQSLKYYKPIVDYPFKNASKLYFDAPSKKLYVGSIEGLGYLRDDEFINLNIPLSESGIANVHTIYSDKKGNVFCSHGFFENVYNNETSIEKHYLKEDTVVFVPSINGFVNNSEKTFIGARIINKLNVIEISIFEIINDEKVMRSFLMATENSSRSIDNYLITKGEEHFLVYNHEKIAHFTPSPNDTIFFNKNDTSTFLFYDLKDINEKVQHLIEDQIGNIVVTTNRAVYHIGKDSLEMVIDLEEKNEVVDFKVDNKNNYWLAVGDQVLKYVNNDFEYAISEKDGLVGKDIFSITLDTLEQKIWCSTYTGITEISIAHFDSLKSNSKNDSLILFAEINDSSFLLIDKELKLNYDEKQLVFEVSSFNFKNKGKSEFYYSLRANDDEQNWIKHFGNNLRFPGLSFGDYKLSFKRGLSSKVETYAIKISPPWWRSKIFFILLGLFLILSSFSFFKARENNLIKKNKVKIDLERKINDLEQQALGSMMNPHFIFNSLNSIQFFINNNDSAQANEYLGKFSRLIRMNLDFASEKLVLLSDEITRLKLYLELESLRFQNKFDYSIDIEQGLDEELVQIPSMLIQPLVENSIWHGLTDLDRKGKINIEIKEVDNDIVILIKDNGRGLGHSKSKHVSKGIALIENRVNLFGISLGRDAKLTIENILSDDNEIKGVKAEISIPDINMNS